MWEKLSDNQERRSYRNLNLKSLEYEAETLANISHGEARKKLGF